MYLWFLCAAHPGVSPPSGVQSNQCYGPRASRPHGRPPPPARAAPVPWVLALLHHRTPRTRPGTAGLARQQRSRSCCERRTAPTLHKMHALTRPSATPPCASHGLGASASAGLEAAVSPQRAAPCAPHQSRKTSRDNTPHLCPPLQNAGVEWMQNGMGIRRRGPRRRLGI